MSEKLVHKQIYQSRQEQIKNISIRLPRQRKFIPGKIYVIKIYEIGFNDELEEAT